LLSILYNYCRCGFLCYALATDKQAVFDLVIGKIEKEIAKDEGTLAGLRQASIDAPGAMESHSDTNKFQSGSLANSVGLLIEEKYTAVLTCSNRYSH